MLCHAGRPYCLRVCEHRQARYKCREQYAADQAGCCSHWLLCYSGIGSELVSMAMDRMQKDAARGGRQSTSFGDNGIAKYNLATRTGRGIRSDGREGRTSEVDLRWGLSRLADTSARHPYLWLSLTLDVDSGLGPLLGGLARRANALESRGRCEKIILFTPVSQSTTIHLVNPGLEWASFWGFSFWGV